MGQILGVLGELIPIVGGIYCVIYFGGYKTPKYKDENQKINFENLRNKYGKTLYYLGIFLIFFGVFGIIRTLMN